MSNQEIQLKVPSVGESVTEVEIGAWLKQAGDLVRQDEPVAVLETDKATMEVNAPASGRLGAIIKTKGQKVKVGEVIATLLPGEADAAPRPPAPASQAAAPAQTGSAASGAPPAPPIVMPAAARLAAQSQVDLDKVQPSGPGNRITKEDVQRAAAGKSRENDIPAATSPTSQSVAVEIAAPVPPPAPAPQAAAPSSRPSHSADGGRSEEVVPMTLLRRKIAERLLAAQKNAALLTTFNEIDMQEVMALRKEYQDQFNERYKTKLGFMSFFVKAVVEALKDVPQVNAQIRGNDIVYRNYYDIGVAIGGGRGLVVPVLRGAERMSFAEIELAIAEFGRKAREGKIRPEDLEGGTFTITNGGIYGSLLSTPLINPPQSGVLGMHAIQERPVALNGQVVIRPMMYVALTYDHRLVDGREAVTFLKRIKDLLENPVRMLVEI